MHLTFTWRTTRITKRAHCILKTDMEILKITLETCINADSKVNSDNVMDTFVIMQ